MATRYIDGRRIRLTLPQEFAIWDIAEATGPVTAPGVAKSIATVRVLARLGLVEHRAGSGKFATWVITAAGRQYVEWQKQASAERAPRWLG